MTAKRRTSLCSLWHWWGRDRHCGLYKEGREKYFDKLANLMPQFYSSSETDQMQMLLGEDGYPLIAAKFIFQLHTIRNHLLLLFFFSSYFFLLIKRPSIHIIVFFYFIHFDVLVNVLIIIIIIISILFLLIFVLFFVILYISFSSHYLFCA